MLLDRDVYAVDMGCFSETGFLFVRSQCYSVVTVWASSSN